MFACNFCDRGLCHYFEMTCDGDREKRIFFTLFSCHKRKSCAYSSSNSYIGNVAQYVCLKTPRVTGVFIGRGIKGLAFYFHDPKACEAQIKEIH